MEIKDTLNIAKDFSPKPGARYISDGSDVSAEAFLKILIPRLDKAIKEKYILKIVLDGVMGFPSSFVSGSFGKLSLERTASLLLKHILFDSDDNPIRKEQIVFEINNPKNKNA
ncbi:MAG: STAS-like domain-containing protein [Bacteroidia bacterium]